MSAAPARPSSTGSIARKTGGTFVLRIEDTDSERSTEAHTQVILDGLSWLGVAWDEGPFFQGAYGARHRADAERLLATGKAYRCFCTREELDAQRAQRRAAGEPSTTTAAATGCPRTRSQRGSPRATPSAIRFRVPDEELAWDDAVHGRIAFQGRDLDDFVILRSDGTAIYNMAVVSRRHRHGHHPRHPRRRSHLQHAEADRALPRAGRGRCRSSPTCR